MKIICVKFYIMVYIPAIIYEAHKAYRLASEKASHTLSPEHPTRLAVALNFSLFYNEIMKEPEKACDLAKEVLIACSA